MPSYISYKNNLKAILDADDTEIESWITVRGNHIPIKKGQSKEEAVKSFLESKGKSTEQKTVQSAMGKTWTGVKLEGKYHQFSKKEDAENFAKQAESHGSKKEDIEIIGFEPSKAKEESKKSKPESKYDPEFEVVRKNALANSSVYGGKYTQKSKAEAYKEYKNDTSSKENMKKANEFVNGTKNKLYGINNGKQVFSIKGGKVVVDPELKTANWYNSKGALTLKQKDLDTDAFIKHGVNELGWQKMTEKEESVLKEFQKIANKPEYKDKEVKVGFEMLPKDYTIAHKDKNGKTTVIAEVSHHDINKKK